MNSSKQQTEIIEAIKNWLETAVIGLGLCPFAQQARLNNQIRYAVSAADSDEKLLIDLHRECSLLDQDKSVETTLLIIPQHLKDFDTFNQFLQLADDLLEHYHWTGLYQLASFHPLYQFAGTQPDDRQNWTNRSPYPILHLLRETSISRVVSSYPAIDQIPENNIKRLNQLDAQSFARIFAPTIRSK